MNSKTENTQSQEHVNPIELLPMQEKGLKKIWWTRWMIILIGSICVAILLPSLPPFPSFYISPAPWLTAGGWVVSQGIDLFSRGKPSDLNWQISHTDALLGLLIVYMIVPAIFLMSWRKLILDKPARQPNGLAVTAFLCCGIVTLGAFGNGPRAAYGALETYRSLRHMIETHGDKNAIMADLNQLAQRARAFYFTPTNLGGGGNHWKNITSTSGSTRDIKLEDLHYKDPMLAKIYSALFQQTPNTFVLDPLTSDTVLTITGIGNGPSDNPSFCNKDGRTGKTQVTMTITPHSQRLELYDENLSIPPNTITASH